MRKRFVQLSDGTLREVEQSDTLTATSARGYILTDADNGLRSPIDGSLIDTRARMKAHMKFHGVAHLDEISPDIARARREQTKEFNLSRVRDVVESYRKVEAGYRPPWRDSAWLK